MSDHLGGADRLDLHIPSINEDSVLRGECGRVHLPTGETCTLQRHHVGSCQFVILTDVP